MKKILLAIAVLFSSCIRKEKLEVSVDKVIGLDVRTLAEINRNPAPGSVHLEMAEVASKFEAVLSDKEAHIAIFCEVGGRAGQVKSFLEARGYTNVKNIGSWREWNELNAI